MRVIVVHNPTAGENGVTKDGLLAALRDAGHDPVYHSTRDDDVPHGVQEAGDILLAAGGDGTVRKVALHIADASTPIVVVPLGTANNLGRMLGMPADHRAIIDALPSMREIRFDTGRVSSPWGERRFIEGVGFGLFAEVMAVAKEHGKEELARTLGAKAELQRDIRLLKALLSLHKPCDCTIEFDGDTIRGDLLLLEVMNIASVGPNLRFAPDADAGDGAFDIVVADESLRPELAAYFEDRLSGNAESVPQLLRRRAATVRVEWYSPLAHVDDKRWAADDDFTPGECYVFELAIEKHALRFLVP